MDIIQQATQKIEEGQSREAQGQLRDALRCYEDALGMLQPELDALGEDAPAELWLLAGVCLNNIGDVYYARGDLERALEYFIQALAIDKAIAPHSQHTATVLTNIGGVYEAQGDLRRALDCHQQALAIIQQVAPNSQEHATILNNIGGVYKAQGDWERAIAHWEQAVQVIESLRARAGSPRAKELLFEQHQSPYQALIGSLYMRNQPDDHARAFHYAERSRARALLDLLAERQIALQPETEEQRRLLEQGRLLRHRLAATHYRLMALRQDPRTSRELIEQLEQEERQLETELEQVVSKIRSVFPAYAQLEYPEPLTLDAVQRRVLDPGVLLLEYCLVKDAIVVWAVRQDAFEMRLHRLAEGELDNLVQDALRRYRAKTVSEAEEVSAAKERAAWARLAEALLGDVPQALWAGVSRLIIVPDGALYYLPFDLLPWGGGRLGEAYPITYAPSATVLDNLRQLWDGRPAPAYEGDFVGFGDPAFGSDEAGDDSDGTAACRFAQRGLKLKPVPSTREEVEGISKRFGARAQVYLGREATEYRVKVSTKGYRYVHFATHGLFEDSSPLHSGLAFAPRQPEEPEDADDLLQVCEMFGLKLDAELVVCSACQTGVGVLRGGEGLIGMSRALFYAGAKCLVVSLWNVPDVDTADLMTQFYKELLNGKSVAEALRAAKAHLSDGDPRGWAGFIPIGLAW